MDKHISKVVKKHWWKTLVKILAWIIAILLVLALALFIWWKTSPYPAAMLIRSSFEKGGIATNKIIEKYAPEGISVKKDFQYDASDKDAYMDVYYPKESSKHYGTIFWVHGGGWLSGNKDDLKPWAEVLAGKGFSVISVNYSLSPEKKYPLPVTQVNTALSYVVSHADALGINPNKILLAGDSAGAQLVAQVALINTNESYAMEFGAPSVMADHKIAGLLLNCGPYDLTSINENDNSEGARLIRAFMWSYTGNKDYKSTPLLKYASIPNYVTAAFPPSFITAGNTDPLLKHSKKLATTLKEKNVETDALFYPDDYKPALNHEYQFNLDTKEGQGALNEMIKFSISRTSH